MGILKSQQPLKEILYLCAWSFWLQHLYEIFHSDIPTPKSTTEIDRYKELQNQNFLTCGSTGTGRKWTAIFRISHFQKSKCSFQVFCILGLTLISVKLLTLVNMSYSLYLYLIGKSSPIIQ